MNVYIYMENRMRIEFSSGNGNGEEYSEPWNRTQKEKLTQIFSVFYEFLYFPTFISFPIAETSL